MITLHNSWTLVRLFVNESKNMRVDIIEKFLVPNNCRISCYIFSENVTGVKTTNTLLLNEQLDLLHFGTENGKIYFIPIANGSLPIHNFRPLDMTKDIETRHAAEISCMLFSTTTTFTNTQNIGLLFSGSLDRAIKVWSISIDHSSTFVQTLFGHTSRITDIIDGKDGTVLSSSEDGTLRVWSPQRGRNIMLYPFFECTFILSFGKEIWLTSIAISSLGPWICYVSDSNGNIDVLKKGAIDNSVESHVKKFMKQLTKFCRWEKVHSLGISYLEIITDENILVTLSYDCTAKLLDPSTGQVLYNITNIRRCMYTGITWLKHLTSFYTIDEFGYLEVFNLYHEKVVETIQLCEVNSKQVTAILKFHAQKAISCIHRFNQDNFFLTIVSNDVNTDSPFSSSIKKKSVGIQGEVILWHLSNDVNCQEFTGHEGTVAGIMVPTSFVTPQFVKNTQLQISKEERIFFSAGNEDNTIRCWDEYDKSESYQLKNKTNKDLSEITVVHAVWYINRIVTGHENGTVCIWNTDTGTTVISRILRNTISSFVEASDSKRSRLLIGADYSGKIVSWNLTLHSMNPNILSQVGGIMEGYHLKEDPGILCLAFHERTKTMFSGGNDCSICFWFLNSDVISGRCKIHLESVCTLKCTDSFLLSGDTLGNLHLSRLVIERLNYSTQGTEIVSGISILCSWSTYPITMNAIGDICELDMNSTTTNNNNMESINTNNYTGGKHVIVTQILGEGRSKVWETWTQRRNNLAGNRSNRLPFNYMDHLINAATKLGLENSSSNNNDNNINKSEENIARSIDNNEELQTKCKIYHISNQELYIFSNELYTLNHDKHDISCCSMTFLDNSSLESFRTSALIYLGTIDGVIFRYSFEKIKSL